MSVFDAEIFAVAVLADARAIIERAAPETLRPELRSAVGDLSADIEATLAALEVESDARRAKALRDDLDTFLPGRKAEIVAIAIKTLPHEEVVALEHELRMVMRTTTIVARAFVSFGACSSYKAHERNY